jgi:hypothetical protein
VDPDLLNPDTDPAFQVNPDSDSDPIQGFDDQKLKKEKTTEIFYIFFDQKLQFTQVQATGEAFSLQKRTSSTLIKEIYSLFSMFVFHFCPPGSGSSL